MPQTPNSRLLQEALKSPPTPTKEATDARPMGRAAWVLVLGELLCAQKGFSFLRDLPNIPAPATKEASVCVPVVLRVQSTIHGIVLCAGTCMPRRPDRKGNTETPRKHSLPSVRGRCSRRQPSPRFPISHSTSKMLCSIGHRTLRGVRAPPTMAAAHRMVRGGCPRAS